MFFFRLIVLFYFSSIGFSAFAQNSKLIFSSKANLIFKISINNVAQHIDFTANLAIIRVIGEQNYSLQIIIENDTAGYKQLIYVIDENATQFYEVTASKIVLSKIIFGTYPLKKSEHITIVPYTQIELINSGKDNVVVKKDTIIADTTYKIPFESYYKMPDYDGKIGCPWPIKDENANEILLQLQQLNLDDRKLELIKKVKENTPDFCLTMQQTAEVINKIQFDETKIDVVKFLFPYIYDQSNLLLLKTNFSYENSYDELKLYFGI